MTEVSIEEQLLNASELFHYAFRFKDNYFLIATNSSDEFEQLIPDFSVLRHSGIKTIAITTYHPDLEERLIKLQQAGSCFEPVVVDDTIQLEQLLLQIEQAIVQKNMPVVLAKNPQLTGSIVSQKTIAQIALRLTALMPINKLFFCGKIPGLVIDDIFYSAPSISDLEAALSQKKKLNISSEDLAFVIKILKQATFDLVLMPAKSGALFQEIFTHLGAGTIISKNNSLQCRAAQLADVPDICLLLKPALRLGTILPISESEVINQISNFYVYTTNNLIVASACLKDYGESLEISKVCTFPRYQGRGLARGLVKELLLRAADYQRPYVFSLSISPRMWKLYEGLGFQEIDKKNLPASWQASYDFKRPSRAFAFYF